jgi:hypothetical protein
MAEEEETTAPEAMEVEAEAEAEAEAEVAVADEGVDPEEETPAAEEEEVDDEATGEAADTPDAITEPEQADATAATTTPMETEDGELPESSDLGDDNGGGDDDDDDGDDGIDTEDAEKSQGDEDEDDDDEDDENTEDLKPITTTTPKPRPARAARARVIIEPVVPKPKVQKQPKKKRVAKTVPAMAAPKRPRDPLDIAADKAKKKPHKDGAQRQACVARSLGPIITDVDQRDAVLDGIYNNQSKNLGYIKEWLTAGQCEIQHCQIEEVTHGITFGRCCLVYDPHVINDYLIKKHPKEPKPGAPLPPPGTKKTSDPQLGSIERHLRDTLWLMLAKRSSSKKTGSKSAAAADDKAPVIPKALKVWVFPKCPCDGKR